MKKASAFSALLLICLICIGCCLFAVGCGEPTDENGFIYEIVSGTKNYRIIGVTDKSRSDLTIPATFGEGTVTAIGDGAFKGCKNVTSVSIPDHIEVLGAGAFDDTGIAPVDHGGYKTVDGWIVEADLEAESVTIGTEVRGVAYNAFAGAKLTEVKYEGTVADWCGIRFSTGAANPLSAAHVLNIGGEKITALDLDGVQSVGFSAFYGCDLTSVSFGDTVTAIGAGAFAECVNLTSVSLPDSVTAVGSSAFYGCVSLTDVALGEGVESIGNGAFMKCESLTSVTVPASVQTMGTYVFNECAKLENITVKGKAKRSDGENWAESWASGSKANENNSAGIHWELSEQ